MAENMTSVLSSVESLMQMFDGKAQDFIREIDNVHMVWLKEIQQEADRMFTRDFNVEPELMPKTPSQKRTTRRKRVSLGRQEDGQARRRFSKGRRSNLRGASSRAINCIAEEAPQASTSKTENTRPKRATRKNKQTKPDEEELNKSLCYSTKSEEVDNMMPEILQLEEEKAVEVDVEKPSSPTESPKCIPSPEVVVAISSSDRLSAELAANQETSPQCTAAKMAIAEPALNTRRTSTRRSSTRRTSMRCSLKLRHSLAGLRQSRIQESVRASARNKLKRMVARKNSTCDSNADDSCMDSVEEEDNAMVLPEPADTEEPDKVIETKIQASVNETLQQQLLHITRSVTVNSPKLAPQPLFTISTPDQRAAEKQQNFQSAHRSSTKRKAPDTAKSPTKRCSAPKKSQSAVRPNMRSFLHTVQKNQMLMMPPSSLDRSTVLKSFIKHTTPLRVDLKMSGGIVTKERYKLEALKKKQEQEIERMKKIEEEKKKKQDELKRKRDERLRRVFEAKEQKEEEKKKRIEQKMAQTDWKNDKRLAEEKTKKKETIKRQEELELKKKLEEEAKKKLQQAEEEKRYHELLAKKKAEEEERAQRLAETRRALELKREQERELEKEQERQAAAKREQFERERALALQRELERAAREKERRELEEKRKALEEKRKREQQQRLAAENKAAREREAAENQKKAPTALNVTVDIERSVISTPVGKGGGLNQTIILDRSVMTTPVAVGALNVTVDIEGSPQSYTITPKGGNKLPFKSTENYGMDQNSDDSTDDESAPRKPIPSWAEGHNLQLFLKKQYFNPPDLNTILGKIEPPNLEIIFNKRKPRYFKRTSSAVWHSPPAGNK